MDDYEGADRRREPEGWHLDKRIPIATLVAILTLAVGGILHITQIRTDLEILRQQQTALAERVQRTDAANTQYLQKIERNLERMNDKLDRSIEQQARTARNGSAR